MNKNFFSPNLQRKINTLAARRKQISLGSVNFDSPLLLAPMSGICMAPYRLLLEQLGCGGTVSELVSCHGINHGNKRTKDMLKIDPREKNVGLQLFGEDAESMGLAARVAQEENPKFIDINMGCPVRKVVSKGGGSALMKDPKTLSKMFTEMKKNIEVPLTIKIRLGWDDDSINAPEIVHIAKEEGIEFVAVHGRTRIQQYKGKARWNDLENLAMGAKLPIIGNGDLHSHQQVIERMKVTNCDALMLGRGPLRNPFIFLESYLEEDDDIQFTTGDYYEVICKLYELLCQHYDWERIILTQLKKQIVWMLAGFNGVSKFRNEVFRATDAEQLLADTKEYLDRLQMSGHNTKKINLSENFMAGGHG